MEYKWDFDVIRIRSDFRDYLVYFGNLKNSWNLLLVGGILYSFFLGDSLRIYIRSFKICIFFDFVILFIGINFME